MAHNAFYHDVTREVTEGYDVDSGLLGKTQPRLVATDISEKPAQSTFRVYIVPEEGLLTLFIP
jgi:hypothetical protein